MAATIKGWGAGLLPAPKRSKYRAVQTFVCDRCLLLHEPPFDWKGACINCRHPEAIKFPSKLEARRYVKLREEERCGQIIGLERQPKFPLTVSGVLIGTYIADFRYIRDGITVIEDTKGIQTPVFRLKRKLLRALYGIEVSIVR